MAFPKTVSIQGTVSPASEGVTSYTFLVNGTPIGTVPTPAINYDVVTSGTYEARYFATNVWGDSPLSDPSDPLIAGLPGQPIKPTILVP